MYNFKHEEQIRNTYPKGTRIKLLQTMDDTQPIEKNEEGSVRYVDDAGTIHMKWDNGRSLGLVIEDRFEIIENS